MTEIKCRRDAFRDQLHELSGQPNINMSLSSIKVLFHAETSKSFCPEIVFKQLMTTKPLESSPKKRAPHKKLWHLGMSGI